MKKHLLTTVIIMVSLFTNAQAPQVLNYQAVARNAAGVALANSSVAIRVSIHDGTASGTVVYSERDTATTNSFGLFSCKIGAGNVISGTFATINWASGDKYMQVELDPTGGSSYTDMGTSQLLSVPYALQAGAASVADTVLHAPALPKSSILSVHDIYSAQTINYAPGTNMRWVNGTANPLAVVDADYTLNYDKVTINTSGRYRITYEVTLSNTVGGTTGNSAEIWMWSTFILYGSMGGIYLGTTDGAVGSASRSLIYDTTAGTELWVTVTQISGNGTIWTQPHGSQFRIERLGN